MLPSSAQLALEVMALGRSQIVATAPPPSGTFLILSAVQNPIHAPSGEKNGETASSVPAIAVASARSSVRAYSCVTLLRMPVNTLVRPSGEIAIAVRDGRTSGSDHTRFSAGRTLICRRVTGGAVTLPRGSSQPTSAPAVNAPSTHGATCRQRDSVTGLGTRMAVVAGACAL